ncbi:hypothetical protein V8F06_003555 [Rhypophila decipiens]
MKCSSSSSPSFVTLLAGLFLLSSAATASSIDFRDSIRHEFKMGLVAPRQGGGRNLQTFTGSLGAPPSAITETGDPKRPFGVDGSTFTDFESAANRACDNQKNECAQIANNQGGNGAFSVNECDRQQEQCKAAAKQAEAQVPTATASAEATFFSSNAEFDFFCE